MATFKDIEQANKTIKTTNIKGKEYAEVNQRIKAFRMLFPEGFIRTQIISHVDGVIVMQAAAGYIDATGAERVLGTGTAFEDKAKGMINGTSYVENCETSAIGRALGMLGLGIDMSVASYEEVNNAIAAQAQPVKKPAAKAPAKKAQPVALVCEACGCNIPAHGAIPAEVVAQQSKKQFGKTMCYDCAHVEKERREAQAAQVDAVALAQEAADALQLPFPIND